jgi:hypothetical protein
MLPALTPDPTAPPTLDPTAGPTQPAGPTPDLTRTWDLAADDMAGTHWTATLVLHQVAGGDEPTLSGYLDWTSSDPTRYGREDITGSFDPVSDTIWFSGTAMEDASGLGLAYFTANTAADGRSLTDGTWSGPGVSAASGWSASRTE